VGVFRDQRPIKRIRDPMERKTKETAHNRGILIHGEAEGVRMRGERLTGERFQGEMYSCGNYKEAIK